MLSRMGVQAEVKLNAWGWYPQGGGEVELRVSGGSKLSGFNLLERGDLAQVRGLAAGNSTAFTYSATDGDESREFVAWG
jgi:RNA 3'-terminal phosphate cyclase